MDTIKIYCDGACSGNPGKGGWGAVLIWRDEIKKLSGFEKHSTNNRMELTAALEGIKAIKKKMRVEIYTDSKYVAEGITTWIHNWKKNNWKSGSKQIKNIDLWQAIDDASSSLEISWHWIKGHSGNYYNEMADSLARQAILDSNDNNY